MADVAREAGVSISAVSLVANDREGVSARTRDRVLAAMQRLGYVPKGGNGSRGLRLFALLIEQLPLPVLSDVFYAEVIHGIQEEAQRLGYAVILQIYGGQTSEDDLLRQLAREEIAGLLVAAGGDISDTMIEHLAATGLPVVLVETVVRHDQFHCVVADNVNAGYLATSHLIQLGHRRIGALSGPTKYSSLVDRLRGYYAALGEAGITPRPEYVPPPQSGTPKKGYLQMKQLLALAEPPTAVFAVSDKTAFGALEAIREAGLRVPDDIAIVSIDNVAESAHTEPPLTTVHVPKREIGILAARRLHGLVTGGETLPTKTVVYSTLVIRSSCGARPSAARAEPPQDDGAP
jgi:DNA-binding LacI/PurR family transcriptional regulator